MESVGQEERETRLTVNTVPLQTAGKASEEREPITCTRLLMTIR